MIPEDLVRDIRTATYQDILHYWEWVEKNLGEAGQAELAKIDRYYLLVSIMNRRDALDPWLYDRCREVEEKPDGCLDLWAREHYKSTIITFAGTIQEIIKDPNITIGIFSHTRPISTKFLKQIKSELEINVKFPLLWPDIFWSEPKKQAPAAFRKWTDERIDVNRTANSKEGTIEAWGLVDGQPTSCHFKLLVYDDVVTRESVSTPEQVQKTTEAWELSDNLGARGEHGESARKWHIGTRYHFGDTYNTILERKILVPRIYPATEDGTLHGKPVLLSQEAWEEKKKTQKTTISSQMLQNPSAGKDAMFDVKDLKWMDIRPGTVNIYIMIDPASSKKKGSDRTAMACVAVDYARNKYLVDGYCHKMALQDRWKNMKALRRHWMSQPGVQYVGVGYERYGLASDIEYFQEQMELDKDTFDITELAWPREQEGKSKIDRIQRLVPDFVNGRFYLPIDIENGGETSNQKRVRSEGAAYRIMRTIRKVDHDGNIYDVVEFLLAEYLRYPYSTHDDLLDAISRIYDMDYQPPIFIDARTLEPPIFFDS